MRDERDNFEGKSGKPAKDLRQERLKLALRENLKRRKSQARARDDFVIAPSDAGAPDGGSEKKPDE